MVVWIILYFFGASFLPHEVYLLSLFCIHFISSFWGMYNHSEGYEAAFIISHIILLAGRGWKVRDGTACLFPYCFYNLHLLTVSY